MIIFKNPLRIYRTISETYFFVTTVELWAWTIKVFINNVIDIKFGRNRIKKAFEFRTFDQYFLVTEHNLIKIINPYIL